MSGILFLCHRFPYPPNKGDKIRSYHLLKLISQHEDVYLGTLIDDPMDWQFVPKMSKQVSDICVVERRRLRRHWMTVVKDIIKGKAITNSLFFSPQLQLWVDALVQSKKISRVFVFSSAMAQYVMKYHKSLDLYTDFVDVDSDKWAQYAKSKWLPANLVYKREAIKLKAYEQEVSKASKASLLVSPQEAALFRREVRDHDSVMSVQNGVQTKFFDPHHQYSNPYQGTMKRVIFTGLMNYWPNVDAVIWFAKEVLPRLSTPVTFVICGANPSKAVFKLSADNVMITGRVPDIRPYLTYADAVVAPLRIARGIQNKVLEAMSMSKPIIASPAAVEGIHCSGVKDLWVEESVEAWVDRLEILLANPPLSVQSHSWVKQHYSWEASLKPLSQLLGYEQEVDKVAV